MRKPESEEGMKIDYSYFCEEALRFLKIMGTRGYTIAQYENAFKGLCYVAFQCDDDRVNQHLPGLAVNYEKRMAYILADQTCESRKVRTG